MITDYLVVGAGATAMAFVDTLLTETSARIVMIDRRDSAGGHWNDTYPFVKLHQPSAYYGVASRSLGRWAKSTEGLNEGFYELASGAEVKDYYAEVMSNFISSGRVVWMHSTEYVGETNGTHLAKSLATGQITEIRVAQKLVDATITGTALPSLRSPEFSLAPGVPCIPINDISTRAQEAERFVVVGGGKTGIDACLWLLENDIDPSRISWVVPNDSWFMNRANTQPGFENFTGSVTGVIQQFQSIIEADSVDDLLMRLESRGLLLRLSSAVLPTSYRCATISILELEQLKRITSVVRLGRIREITSSHVVYDRGCKSSLPNTLYIDCSASAVQPTPEIAVFTDSKINLLWLKWCQPVFSAAVIAFVEANIQEREKNDFCRPMRRPEFAVDWLLMWGVTLTNMAAWRSNAAISDWLSRCRLNSATSSLYGMGPSDVVDKGLLDTAAELGAKAAANIPRLLRNVPVPRQVDRGSPVSDGSSVAVFERT